MKKLFNHTKRPVENWKNYDEEAYDWDSLEDENYSEGESIEEEPWYEEESTGEEEFYYEEEVQGEEEEFSYEEEITGEEEEFSYEEEAQGEEEEFFYEEEVQGEEEEFFYEEEITGEEETFYYEEEGIEAEEDPYYEEAPYGESEQPGGGQRLRGNLWLRLAQHLNNMGALDKVIMGTGAAVLVLALVIVGMFISSRVTEGQVARLADVGSQLDGIDMIGERGLLAVADAELARLAAAEAVQEEPEAPKVYQEAEYARNITVSLNLTSVQKDLKIKFINQSNNKLIPNVPFTVTVTDSGGKSSVWSDDDMDGIIYKKDITPGTYTVSVMALEGEQYSNYSLSAESRKVDVKKDIDYKKVDVTNEIKKESEVNAAKEDTRQNATVVESSLTDTVDWVESKVVDAVYNEVPKSSIPDPATLIAGNGMGTLTRVAETSLTVSGGNGSASQGITLDKSEVTLAVTGTAAVNATLSGASAAAPLVSAVSADANIATVSADGTTVTVTGVSVGSTQITVSYTENGITVFENFSVVVKSNPREDTVTKLKDADGNQLYVLENNVYREAVYADYYTAERFFVRATSKYSGWQTLDGKVYYFDARGEKVTGEQIIQGAKYNFASDGSLVTGSGTMGIDVSKWNGNIDWEAVSNSGVSYVIIRCGYRGSSEGKLIEDPKFAANIKGATSAGLKVGIYFFTQAVDEIEAVEEASMVLEQIKGYKISYPVFLDVEPSGGRADSIDRATRTAVCKAFCETINGAGYTAGIYANKTWLTGKLNAGELNAYKIWLAQYAAEPTYNGKYDLWQYKSSGKVTGIKGNVDMNLSYLGY